MFHVATTEDVKRQLIEAIRACGAGWHDRVEIAHQLGKNYPNPSETTILNMMAEAGEIEKAMQPSKQPHIMRVVYKLKEDKK